MSDFCKCDEELRWRKAISLAKIGWWEVDYERQVYYCSDFVVNLLGLKSNELGFDEFINMIRWDYREKATSNMRFFKGNEIYEQRFPILTSYGQIWVLSRAEADRIDADGKKYATGILQQLSSEEIDYQEQKVQRRLDKLKKKQYDITQSLFSFLREKDIDQAIQNILDDVLTSLEVDRVCIIEYDKNNWITNCTYEAHAEDIESSKESCHALPMDEFTWWTQQIKCNIPIVLSRLEQLPAQAALAKEKMEEQGVKSIMVVPLVFRDDELGYVCADMVKEYRDWDSDDSQWFFSISNIIGICLELRRREEKMRKAYKTLEYSEAILRNIYSNLPAGIELYDRDGFLIDVNDREMEMFGMRSKEDCKGLNIFTNPVIPENIKENLKRGENGSFTFSYNFDKLNKHYIGQRKGEMILSAKGVPLYNSKGELICYLFINVDSTEIFAARDKIQEFKDFFELVGDYAKVGYAHYNAITKEGYAIDSWYRNIGESSETTLPYILENKPHVHPDDVHSINTFLQKAITGEMRNMRETIRIVHNDGKITWSCYNCIVRDYSPEKGIVDVVSINYDVTELKEMEIKLIEAKDKAETSDRLKSAFLANMSHEIRTPLNAIVGFSALLIDTNDLEERELYASIVKENNELLLQLISDILDFSRIAAGTFEITRNDMNIRQLCFEIINSYQVRDTKDVQIKLEENLLEYCIVSDKYRITQVISNFINNALKFTKSGSIVLGYHLISDFCLRIYVRDTGIGIPADKIETIFNRFTKLNTFVPGTGLGLSISKSIVEQMGGSIGVESTVGEGSCFWFTHEIKK